MRFQNLRAWTAALGLLASQTLAFGQDAQIQQLIKGEGSLPPYMKIKELPVEYKSVKIELAKGGSDGGLGSLMPLMMMGMSSQPGAGGGGGAALGMLMMGSFFNSYWTKADMVKMGGHEFLVAYKLELGLRKDAPAGAEGPPFAASLRLSLIRTDMIAALSPDPKATIADVVKFLDEAQIPYDHDVQPVEMNSETAVSAAVLFPVFSQAKEAARRTATLSNAKQLALGAHIYMSDYDDVMPYVQGTQAAKFVFEPYLKTDELWKSANPAGGEFKMNMAVAGVEVTEVDHPAETVLFYEENPWADGRRVAAFLDGHAKVLSPEEWDRASATLKLKLKRKAKPLPLNYGKR